MFAIYDVSFYYFLSTLRLNKGLCINTMPTWCLYLPLNNVVSFQMVSKKHDSQRIRLEVPRVVQGSSGSQRARERSCGWGGLAASGSRLMAGPRVWHFWFHLESAVLFVLLWNHGKFMNCWVIWDQYFIASIQSVWEWTDLLMPNAISSL